MSGEVQIGICLKNQALGTYRRFQFKVSVVNVMKLFSGGNVDNLDFPLNWNSNR